MLRTPSRGALQRVLGSISLMVPLVLLTFSSGSGAVVYVKILQFLENFTLRTTIKNQIIPYNSFCPFLFCNYHSFFPKKPRKNASS